MFTSLLKRLKGVRLIVCLVFGNEERLSDLIVELKGKVVNCGNNISRNDIDSNKHSALLNIRYEIDRTKYIKNT